MTDYKNQFNGLYREINKSISERNRLNYFKNELIKILDKQLQDENSISKSIEEYDLMMQKSLLNEFGIQKAVYGVGTVREWNGKKYRKIAPGKWRRIYTSNVRGINVSIENVKKAITNAKDFKELGEIVSQNFRRFYDNEGKILPIAQQILDEAKGKQYNFRNNYPDSLKKKGLDDSQIIEYMAIKNLNYEDEIDKFVRNGLKGGQPITLLRNTPKILQQYKVLDNEITIDPGILRKILTDDKKVNAHAHNMNIEMIKDLPIQLENPLAIIESNTNKKVVLTEFLDEYDNPIIAIIEINKNISAKHKINSIRSYYGKHDFVVSDWLNDTKKLLYVDKKRSDLIASIKLQSLVNDNLTGSLL